jgi:hypothetical protein
VVVFAVARHEKASTFFRCIVELHNKYFNREGRILASAFGREAKHQLKGKLVQRSNRREIHALTLSKLTSRIVSYSGKRENLSIPIEADSGIRWQPKKKTLMKDLGSQAGSCRCNKAKAPTTSITQRVAYKFH